LKCATITTTMKAAKVRAEPKTICTVDVNISVTLQRWCCWSNKLSILF